MIPPCGSNKATNTSLENELLRKEPENEAVEELLQEEEQEGEAV